MKTSNPQSNGQTNVSAPPVSRILLPIRAEEKKSSSGNRSSNEDAKSEIGGTAIFPQLALLRRSSGTTLEGGDIPPVLTGVLATGTLAAPASVGRGGSSFSRRGVEYVSGSPRSVVSSNELATQAAETKGQTSSSTSSANPGG